MQCMGGIELLYRSAGAGAVNTGNAEWARWSGSVEVAEVLRIGAVGRLGSDSNGDSNGNDSDGDSDDSDRQDGHQSLAKDVDTHQRIHALPLTYPSQPLPRMCSNATTDSEKKRVVAKNSLPIRGPTRAVIVVVFN
ncbi:hypothetical protein PMIN04_002389 [Paraphaeosphaeria minitans]